MQQSEASPVPLKAGDALLVEDMAAAQQHLLLHPKMFTAY